jgi:transcriptional regulator with XRE-family HTH domain
MGNTRKREPQSELLPMARRLLRLRQALGKDSGAEVIGKLKISRTSYSSWENAIARVSLDAALLLCKKYKLSLDWLYFGHVGKIDDPELRKKIRDLTANDPIED